MSRETPLPTIWLVQRDAHLRAQLAAGLRRDGMSVVEFAAAEAALEALRTGGKAAVLVTQPAGRRLTNRELTEQAWVMAPKLEIIFTPGPDGTDDAPTAGAHLLVGVLTVFRLSRFIRLVAAKPALRSSLQGGYRRARSAESPLVAAP